MIQDTNVIIKELIAQTQTNEIIIQYHDHVGFLKREDYYPSEDGMIVFHKKLSVKDDDGYSVAEMLELLLRYRDVVGGISFQAWDNSLQPFINMYESEAFSGHGNLSTVIMVGDEEDTNFIDKVTLSYGESLLYPELRGIPSSLKTKY